MEASQDDFVCESFLKPSVHQKHNALLPLVKGVSKSMTNSKLLFIITSAANLGESGKKTGYYIPELAHPYNYLKDHFDITLASPLGGRPPVDPGSLELFKEDAGVKMFLADKDIQDRMGKTLKLSELSDTKQFVGVFIPGGHGPMYDLNIDPISQRLIAQIYDQGSVVSSVCHGPASLLNVKLGNGELLIKGKNLTAFCNVEEEQAGLTKVVPYLLEDELVKRGAKFQKAKEAWGEHVVVDGRLVTGQNPASALEMAVQMQKLILGGK